MLSLRPAAWTTLHRVVAKRPAPADATAVAPRERGYHGRQAQAGEFGGDAQRSRAVVLEHGKEILGADVRVRYRLGGPSTVQTALAALQRQDLIAREDDGRYVAVDSLMREWVARRTH